MPSVQKQPINTSEPSSPPVDFSKFQSTLPPLPKLGADTFKSWATLADDVSDNPMPSVQKKPINTSEPSSPPADFSKFQSTLPPLPKLGADTFKSWAALADDVA